MGADGLIAASLGFYDESDLGRLPSSAGAGMSPRRDCGGYPTDRCTHSDTREGRHCFAYDPRPMIALDRGRGADKKEAAWPV
jgi:hypothetical protein